MDVCKWIVPLRLVDTLNSHRAASPLVSLREGKGDGIPLTTSRVFSLKIGGNLAKSYCLLNDAQSYG
ncbi:hypothetical protein TNCV_83471 [Trichonephila clavipes]|nr:hypothetical protein TNCV_83471 [Trichonephila clavipes]